jgi:hypothetical protein
MPNYERKKSRDWEKKLLDKKKLAELGEQIKAQEAVNARAAAERAAREGREEQTLAAVKELAGLVHGYTPDFDKDSVTAEWNRDGWTVTHNNRRYPVSGFDMAKRRNELGKYKQEYPEPDGTVKADPNQPGGYIVKMNGEWSKWDPMAEHIQMVDADPVSRDEPSADWLALWEDDDD